MTANIRISEHSVRELMEFMDMPDAEHINGYTRVAVKRMCAELLVLRTKVEELQADRNAWKTRYAQWSDRDAHEMDLMVQIAEARAKNARILNIIRSHLHCGDYYHDVGRCPADMLNEIAENG